MTVMEAEGGWSASCGWANNTGSIQANSHKVAVRTPPPTCRWMEKTVAYMV